MCPIYHTDDLHSATSAQVEVGQGQSGQVVQRPKVLDATILEHITEAFIALDRQWCVTYCNQKAAALLQGVKEELPGKNVWEMFPELVGSTFYHRCHKSVATGNVEQFEVRSRRHQKWIHIYIVPSPDDIIFFLRDVTVEKQAKEQQQFQANILRHIRDSVIVTDLQGKITYWNEGAGSIFGYTPEEMIGQAIARLSLDQDIRQVERNLETIASGKYSSREWQGQRKDGAMVWIDVKTTLLWNEDGEACGFLGVAKDITERKLAEERVQHSEKLFRALIENSSDAIALMKVDGIFIYASASTARVLGYQPEELIGRNVFGELVHPDDLELTRRNFAALLQEAGKSQSAEFRMRHKDGSWRWVEGSGLNLLDDPAVAAIVVNYRDITERKHLDEELRRSRDQLEVILKNVDDGIIVQDASGKIIYANHVVAIRAGYTSAEELLATPPSAYWARVELTDEQGQPFSYSQLPGRRAIQGEVNPQAHIRYVNKQTQEVGWTLIKATVVFERDHTPLLVINVLQDTTQFKELEQRKDEFILHVSHELRTPLTALTGFLELLTEYGARLNEQTKAVFLSRSLENCQELMLLVNAVLDVLQIKYDTQPARPNEIVLACLVREVFEQLDPGVVQKYMLQMNIPEQLKVWADEQYLTQVLRNLLLNACKYAPTQTPIVISAAYCEDPERENSSVPQVCVSIRDAGPGIPPAERTLLFERFARLKRDIASKVRGTGLGLYICKQLVEKMGGHIWVESSGRVGEGSCFCFTLPAGAPTP